MPNATHTRRVIVNSNKFPIVPVPKQDNFQLCKKVSNSRFHSRQLTKHAEDTYWGKLHENGGNISLRKVLV
jgi:hypothetical protein